MTVSRSEYITGLLMGAILLAPLLVFGAADVEETALGIFASQVHYTHMVRGEWLYWFNDLGFGTPLPIGHRLDAHPAFALAASGSLRLGLSALWIMQVVLATVYMLRVLAGAGVKRPLRLWLLAFYLFSASSICWFYMNDWVTFVIGWTTLPALLYYLDKALRIRSLRDGAPALATLALAFAFLILNSHPGYVAPLAVALTIYALAAAPRRLMVYAGLGVAALLCAGIAVERLYYFVHEALLFPADVLREPQNEYALREYGLALLAPFEPLSGKMREPFVGVGIVVAACLALVRARRLDANVRGCLAALVGSFALSLVPPSWFALYTAASGSWLFRDPLVFFAIIGGGVALQSLLDSPRQWVRRAVWVLVLVQAGQQVTVVQAAAVEYNSHVELARFVQAPPSEDLCAAVQPHTGRFGRRVYLSPAVDEVIRGGLTKLGLHAGTDLALCGLNPVNAWFKVVSMDALYPSAILMHGRIRGEQDVTANQSLLETLGIGLVLQDEREGSVPEGLVLIRRIDVESRGARRVLLLLGNEGAWGQASVLSTAARGVALPQRPGCPNDRALCRDFSPLGPLRRGQAEVVRSRHGGYTVRLTPSQEDQLLFLSVLHRPEWQATSGGRPLPVESVAGAFLGVLIPTGVTDVELVYRPLWRMRLTWFGAVLALLLAGYLATTARARRRAPR